MRTTTIGIENLCVPCHSFCRYCLLSSCGKTTGVDYDRGKRFVERLHREIEEKHPELNLMYYIGYCMDTPDLTDYIRFSQKIGSPSAKFLQLNGLTLRDEVGTAAFVGEIREVGIELVDLTFYGTKAYHDRFAGRPGDFDYLLRILAAANRAGLPVRISYPLQKENMHCVEEVMKMLEAYQISEISVFLPHCKGRGKTLDDQRLTSDDYESLSERVKKYLRSYRTEQEFLKDAALETPGSRVLALALKPENIEQLESMSLEEILAYLEDLDDRYYNAIPPVEELAARYGRKEGKRLYRRFRDLHLEWQQRFLADSGAELWDMNDETHHFSVRV